MPLLRISSACAPPGCRSAWPPGGEPRKNGYAERLIRTIKEEEVALNEYHDFADAQRQLGRSLNEVYGKKRIHAALGSLTPAEFEATSRADQAQPLHNHRNLSVQDQGRSTNPLRAGILDR